MIKIRSPGRICLFGEHQDYLGFPVIALAISKYIYLSARKIDEKKFLIDLPDISSEMEIRLNSKELGYESTRDYLRSSYNLFLRKGVKFNHGYKVVIHGDLPINSGVASSSALVIAWIKFLDLISNTQLDAFALSTLGYEAEVKEFGEAGGMMDHFTSVFGNLIYLDLKSTRVKLHHYDLDLEGFILGDSLERKNTVEDLLKVKRISLQAFEVLSKLYPNFNPYETKIDELQPHLASLSKEHQKKVIGHLINREITLRAKNLINNYYAFPSRDPYLVDNFYQALGTLLNEHHEQLRHAIGITTPKIDTMVDYCIKEGALGAKVNGSGFGGTMFALATRNLKEISNTLFQCGAKAYIISTSTGVEIS
jgi:galactokinase